MGLDLKVVEINRGNSEELASFIEDLGNERESFRYFNSRGMEVLENRFRRVLIG